MEAVALIVMAAVIIFLWVRAIENDAEYNARILAQRMNALQDRCTYLEHLIGDRLLRKPERLEGDEWKDGVTDE